MLGIAMLWAWNMFLAAAPYFQKRFRTSKSILNNFQPTELSVSTIGNLGSVFVLAKLQSGASYPKRIMVSLLINIVTFTLLAISTRTFLDISAGAYLGFLILMVFCTSLATGFMQNGAFAYVNDYRRPEYIQAIVVGQAIAGVLPPIVQIGSVLSTDEAAGAPSQAGSTSAFAYFLAATGVSTAALCYFFYLKSSHGPSKPLATTPPLVEDNYEDDPLYPSQNHPGAAKRSIPLTYLTRRLFFFAASVSFTFALTMLFPVYSQEILTTNPNPPPLLQSASFIPLGMLFWNVGDLVGRLIPLSNRLSLASRPRILFILSIARIVFIPLYLLCNIIPPEESPEALFSATRQAMPDAFYLLVVQVPFGLTNGYLGACCLMGAPSFVEEDEREAAGAFMGLMLSVGLAVGSLCSFFVGNS